MINIGIARRAISAAAILGFAAAALPHRSALAAGTQTQARNDSGNVYLEFQVTEPVEMT